MTPKEKAKKLIYRYHDDAISKMLIIQGNPFDFAKQCALIAVDELIESHLLLTTTHESEPSIRCKRYWQEVKQELEKL